MAQVNPDIPVIGNPVATEDPKVKNALEAIVNALNAIDNANIASNADINGAKLLAGSVNTTQLADAAITAAKIAPGAVSQSGTAAPVASILQFAGSTAPSGWIICDGAAVSRSTYSDLFTAIGTAYGEGNGSTTFNLPNLKGRVPVGLDSSQTEFDARGETGGAKTHTLTSSEIASHNHSISLTSGSGGTHNHTVTDNTIQSWVSGQRGTATPTGTTVLSLTEGSTTQTTSSHTGHTHSVSGSSSSAGGGGAHNNLQPYVVVNYIIKT